MSITLNGDTGITTPMYNGTISANAVTPSVSMKNRIINGAMVIDQRNAGASGTATGYTVDRWNFSASLTTKGTWQQNAGSVTPPAGFTNYLGFTSNSAYTVAADEQWKWIQPIEGYNMADFNWGSVNAKTITLSFWVRSSLTGTFGGALTNASINRSYPFTYTISSANTWTQASVTIAGDTSGTWNTTNGVGMYVQIGMGVGSTYSGTAGAWASTYYASATGATSVVGTNGATFYITGVQLEVGSSATSFDYRQYGQELALCQRYYTLLVKGADVYICGAYYYSTGSIYGHLSLPVQMRASPTSAIVSGTGYYTFWRTASGNALNSLSLNNSNNQVISFYNGSEASGTAGIAGGLYTSTASSFVAVQAEL